MRNPNAARVQALTGRVCACTRHVHVRGSYGDRGHVSLGRRGNQGRDAPTCWCTGVARARNSASQPALWDVLRGPGLADRAPF